MRAARLDRRATLLLIGSALLAGCASRLPPVVRAVDDAHFSGRMAMRVAASPRSIAQSVNAGFELHGRPDAGQIEFGSPLGTLIAQARWKPGEVQLVTPQGSRRFGDLDQLSREALGEVLPLAALFDWLRGRPWSGAASGRLAAAERPGFSQLGWEVDLSRFDSGIISAERPLAPAVQLSIQLER